MSPNSKENQACFPNSYQHLMKTGQAHETAAAVVPGSVEAYKHSGMMVLDIDAVKYHTIPSWDQSTQDRRYNHTAQGRIFLETDA